MDLDCVDHEIGDMESDRFLHRRLLRSAKSILGLDYESKALQAMRNVGFEVAQDSAEEFDLGGRKFDVVVAGEILEHLPNHRSMLNSVRKHLNPGGELIITVPNSGGLFYVACTLLFGHETDSWDHTCMFSGDFAEEMQFPRKAHRASSVH